MIRRRAGRRAVPTAAAAAERQLLAENTFADADVEVQFREDAAARAAGDLAAAARAGVKFLNGFWVSLTKRSYALRVASRVSAIFFSYAACFSAATRRRSADAASSAAFWRCDSAAAAAKAALFAASPARSRFLDSAASFARRSTRLNSSSRVRAASAFATAVSRVADSAIARKRVCCVNACDCGGEVSGQVRVFYI